MSGLLNVGADDMSGHDTTLRRGALVGGLSPNSKR